MTTNEKIELELKKLFAEEKEKVTIEFNKKINELKNESKKETEKRVWNLKPNYSCVITDVTPAGYGI
jgi:hypothetical protein